MPAPPNYRKRRPAQGPNKNELKASRLESQEQQQVRAGNLRERFPTVRRLKLDLRMETTSGATLEQVTREIKLDEPFLLNVTCQGGCGNGEFLLTDAIVSVLEAAMENKQGMGICQAASYQDPKVPCGTKLYYKVDVEY
jgi:hypothetical protein